MTSKLMTMLMIVAPFGCVIAQSATESDGRKETARMDLAVRFTQLDKNGDGKMTLEELTNGFSALPLGPRHTGQEQKPEGNAANSTQYAGSRPALSAAEFFKAADTNNDGVLSVEEFTSMVEKIRASGRSGGGMGA